MRCRLISLLFLLSWTTAALAQFNPGLQPGVKLRGRNASDLYAAQKVVLSNYCRLDFAGARLQPEGWVRFKPFTTIRANPEYTRITIVSRFDVESPSQPSDYLTVNYQKVGFYQQGEGYTPAVETDQVEFRVQERNGDLLVTGVTPDTPHVSARAAIAWMNLLLRDAKTAEPERAHLKDAVLQLNELLARMRAAGE
jgi:hypothetical protein